MRVLSNNETNQITGAFARMSGSFSMNPNGMTFGSNFAITVTDNSANSLGNFKAYANKVVDGSTGTVLFDGTQNSFCINGSSFSVTPIQGGHVYKYIGPCA